MPCGIVELGTWVRLQKPSIRYSAIVQSELYRKFCPNRNDKGDYSDVLFLRKMQCSVVYSIRNYNTNV